MDTAIDLTFLHPSHSVLYANSSGGRPYIVLPFFLALHELNALFKSVSFILRLYQSAIHNRTVLADMSFFSKVSFTRVWWQLPLASGYTACAA